MKRIMETIVGEWGMANGWILPSGGCFLSCPDNKIRFTLIYWVCIRRMFNYALSILAIIHKVGQCKVVELAEERSVINGSTLSS